MRHLDEVSAAAKAIGAVNTLWREGAKLLGDNTDAYGFLANLDERAPGWEQAGRRALVLGAGGAARAVVYALLSRGYEIVLINRTLERAQVLADSFGEGVRATPQSAIVGELANTDLLVNTTALGMAGKPALELDVSALNQRALVHDIVYVPLETDLLRQARLRGHQTIDGLGMLIHQAVPAFERWFGARPKPDTALRALLEADIVAAMTR